MPLYNPVTGGTITDGSVGYADLSSSAVTSLAEASAFTGTYGRKTTVQREVIAPCTDGSHYYTNGVSGGVNTWVESRTRYTTKTAVRAIRLYYLNTTAVREGASVAQATLRAGFDDGAGNLHAVYFSGKRDVVLDAGGSALSDWISVPLASGTAFYIRSLLTVASGTFPQGRRQTQTGEANSQGTGAPTDHTTSGSVTAGATYGYHPVVIQGRLANGETVALGGVGDSILAGQNDTDLDRGILYALANSASVPYANVAMGGEACYDFYIGGRGSGRKRALFGVTHVLENYGANDLPSGRTFATIQADWLALATDLTNMGIKVAKTTIMPRSTSSTDSFYTTANQTAHATYNPLRIQLNEWIRAGMPIDPNTKAAVVIGTVGALVAGNTGHPYTTWIEWADVVETARDSGIWNADGTAGNRYTTDGTHPSAVAITAVRAASQAAVNAFLAL